MEINVTHKHNRPSRCAYCHDTPPERPIVCNACSSPHHPECWVEYGSQCSVCNFANIKQKTERERVVEQERSEPTSLTKLFNDLPLPLFVITLICYVSYIFLTSAFNVIGEIVKVSSSVIKIILITTIFAAILLFIRGFLI